MHDAARRNAATATLAAAALALAVSALAAALTVPPAAAVPTDATTLYHEAIAATRDW